MNNRLNPMLLISDTDHSLALPGTLVKDFRGTVLTLVKAEPGIPPSTGRIYVSEPGKHARIDSFYPSVCDLRWRPANAWKQLLIDDGCPEEEAEGMVADAITALTRKPYR